MKIKSIQNSQKAVRSAKIFIALEQKEKKVMKKKCSGCLYATMKGKDVIGCKAEMPVPYLNANGEVECDEYKEKKDD